MIPERQKKIDKAYKISGEVMATGFFVLLLGVFFLLKIGIVILNRLGVNVYEWESYDTAKQIYIAYNWIIGGISTFAFIAHAALEHWATDEDKEEFKRTVKDAVLELESEKKTRTKTVYNGKSPLKDYLSDGQIAVIHKFLCDIPDHGTHIKTSELKHKLHVLEDREDIDLSDRDQVLAWVEHITKRSVEPSKFWNEYEWRRSKDQEKKWSKYIITEYDKLR